MTGLLLATWLPWMSAAFAQEATQAQVKTALIYNFIKYTDWPVMNWNTDIPFWICVSPKSELREAAKAVQEKTLHNRRIKVRIYTENSDLGTCDVLYVDSRSFSGWPQARKSIAGRSVLTIAGDDVPDSEGFIIALFLDKDRFAFEIDSKAAQEAQLTISSKLLRLARRVH
jgi:hypothetical protein